MLGASPTGTRALGTAPYVPVADGAHRIPVSGGMTFAGSASPLKTHVVAPAGGISISGSVGPVKTHILNPPDGGITYSGSASLSKTHVATVGGGGLLFGGTAPFTTHDGVHFISTDGGLSFGGAAAFFFPNLNTSFIHDTVCTVVRRTRRAINRDDPGDGDFPDER